MSGSPERFPDPPAAHSTTAQALCQALTDAAGEAIRALVLYGSHLHKADATTASAWDVVVIVDDYRAFHRALRASGHHRRPAWLLNLLARVLPPNITAFNAGRPGVPLAKCVVVDADDFARGLAPDAPDHFLKGRMVQQVAVLWSADPRAEEWVHAHLTAARTNVLRWAGPSLEGPVNAQELAHHMLRVSYAGEVRPEGGERVRQVFEAQRDFLDWAYTRVLQGAVERSEMVPVEGGRYRLATPATAADRRRVAAYFRRSKVRSTLRWAKHIVTFNDWLTYVQKKVERRTGMEIHLTKWERRLPLLLLWPKVFMVIRNRPRFDIDDSDEAPSVRDGAPGSERLPPSHPTS